MASFPSPDHDEILSLARRHGLELGGPLDINELGLDFRVATGDDHDGQTWVLRIPRRPDMDLRIRHEAAILAFLRTRLPFAVPDWRIVSTELIAYPRLNDPTAIVVDAATYEVSWNIAMESESYVSTCGKALAALHHVPSAEAVAAGMKVATPDEVRAQIARDIDRVKGSFEINAALESRWRTWLEDDNCWPDHSVPVHGDLYAGHILVNTSEEVTGMIDWSEAAIGDPSTDFTAHLQLFGEQGLLRLIHHYEAAGGKTWPDMARHVAERLSIAPLRYALFALETGDPGHRAAAGEQLLGT